MKLYRHWAAAEQSIKDAEGNPLRLRKWGGSNHSAEDAASTARRKVDELARRLMQAADLRWSSEYTYSTRDLPEEVVEEIDAHSGITRNRYGCLVLNSDNMLVADIDLPRPGWFAKLMKVMGKHKALTEAEAILKLTEWLMLHPQMGARVYRTAAGLRYLFTQGPVEPDNRAINWLTELGSDRLYVRLCREQQCFRARLSPKPWRCGQPRPPAQLYPFNTEGHASTFATWLQAYQGKAAAFATCQHIGTYGQSGIHADLQPQVTRHDELTCSSGNLPLA